MGQLFTMFLYMEAKVKSLKPSYQFFIRAWAILSTTSESALNNAFDDVDSTSVIFSKHNLLMSSDNVPQNKR